jgi:predicted AAA+ superfamily ATPase
MERLKSISQEMIQSGAGGFKRFLYHHISLSKRITGIKGAAGVGKTSLLLQLMANKLEKDRNSIYVNLNDPYFAVQSLFEFALMFHRRGGEVIFIDDLQKYRDPENDILRIMKELGDIKIVFTSGSIPWEDKMSMMPQEDYEIHTLPGLSFREFLEYRYEFAFPVIKFDELLELNRNPGIYVLNRIRPLQYFSEYLRSGYYLFQNAKLPIYQKELTDKLFAMLEGDFPPMHKTDYDSILKIRRLLSIIAVNGPFKPNIESIARQTGTTRDSLLKFIEYTGDAAITRSIYYPARDGRKKPKPRKIYLDNSNLIPALSPGEVDDNFLFETFLVNQLDYGHDISIEGGREGVIKVDGRYRFQPEWNAVQSSAQMPYDYLISPELDHQKGTRVPLWMFGFLY